MKIDMELITELLNSENIPAYVEQTGGGCATIYAGRQKEVPGDGTRYQVIAGPGWFEGPYFSLPKADSDDFYVGPDDDGESTPIECSGMTEMAIADLIKKKCEAKSTRRGF